MSRRAIKLLSPAQLLALPPKTTIPLDASWHMPGSPIVGREEYLKARIPHARFWDVDEVASSHPLGLKHMMPSAEQFASAAAALGISRDSHVVIYDAQGLFSAPRTAFTFASFGHEHVSILDGGFPRWKAEDHEIEYGSPAPFESGFYPTPDSEATSTLDYDAVVANISSGESAVLDARPKPRFTAEAPEPRAGLPSGHIPGSRSLPFGELVKDGQLRSDEELKHLLLKRLGPDADAVLKGKKPVFATCGSGMTASVIWLALNRLGVDARIYDESWSGYAARPESEIASGET